MRCAHRSIGRFGRCKLRSPRRYRRPLLDQLALTATDGPHPLKDKSRAMDGRLARPDADHGDRRARGHARAQRVPDHGSALDPGLRPAVSADPDERRICRAEDDADAATCRAQSDPLCGAARLVLRAHVDPHRASGGDRIHHADLDRDLGRGVSRRAHDGMEDPGYRARRYRRRRHRSTGNRRDQSGSS